MIYIDCMGKKKKQRKPKPKAPKQNMRKILAESQELQKKFAKTQVDLQSIEFVFEHQGVKLDMLGSGEIKQINISPTLLTDIPVLEKTIQLAINLAKKKAKEMSDDKTSDAIPSYLDNLFGF